MLALPNQTIEILEDSLKKVIAIKPEHISVYSLILEEGTKLYDLVENEGIRLVDEETERKMYWKVKNILEQKNFYCKIFRWYNFDAKSERRRSIKCLMKE